VELTGREARIASGAIQKRVTSPVRPTLRAPNNAAERSSGLGRTAELLQRRVARIANCAAAIESCGPQAGKPGHLRCRVRKRSLAQLYFSTLH